MCFSETCSDDWSIDWLTIWVEQAVFTASSITLGPRKGGRTGAVAWVCPLQAWRRACMYNHSSPPRKIYPVRFISFQVQLGSVGVWKEGSCPGRFKMFDPTNWEDRIATNWDGEECKSAGLPGEYEERVKFEKPTTYPSGDTKHTVLYMSLEFWGRPRLELLT